MTGTSVFSTYESQAWPYLYAGTLEVAVLAGGIPSDPDVTRGFIESKVKTSDEVIQKMVAKTIVERGASVDEAVGEVAELRHLNGFKRLVKPLGEAPAGTLYIEGRQLKAAIREAVNVAYASGKLLNAQGKNTWGRTAKGIHGFVAEHVIVEEYDLPLYKVSEDGTREWVTAPDDTITRFVHTYRGTGIQTEEVCLDACLDFTVKTDWEFTEQQWAMMWVTGQEQGIGASRSQSYGRYKIVRWDRARVQEPAAAARG